MSVSPKRLRDIAASISWLVSILMLTVFSATAFASGPPLQITNRSLKLQNGSAGGFASAPSAIVNHLFTFSLPTTPTNTPGQSIVLKYCTTADIDAGGTCTKPNGLGTTGGGVTLGTPTGDASTFTSMTNSTPGTIIVSGATTITPAGGASTIPIDGVTNPDNTNCGGTNNCTFYVNIQFYTGSGGTGTLISQGTVAASTSTQITLTGTMPESLIFCTGGTISSTGTIPNCASATSGSITFNKLFSPTGTAFATSQMAASTNALSGYSITVSGAQLSSGSNHIPGIGATAKTSASTVGSSAFGMNLVADTDAAASTPALSPASAALTPASDGVNYWGIAHNNFNTDSSYAFTDSGPTGGSLTLNTIAASDYGAGGPTGSGQPTEGQIYTATYMVNAAANQPAGSYSTTLTYICTPTF
jgi:hypothetical protein